MPKRFSLLVLLLVCMVAADAPAGAVEVAKVVLPQLSPLQWEMLRQQQASHHRPLPVDVSLVIYNGKERQRTSIEGPATQISIRRLLAGSKPVGELMLGSAVGTIS
jgi:hypothetical protein